MDIVGCLETEGREGAGALGSNLRKSSNISADIHLLDKQKK